MIPDFTIQIGLDREHLAEFKATFPTWLDSGVFSGGRSVQLLIDEREPDEFWDRELQFLYALAARTGNFRPDPIGVANPLEWSQRERMLTAFLTSCAFVTTAYVLKIDTDCLFMAGPLLTETGFVAEHHFTGSPAIVAPPWSYSKPVDTLYKLNTWADSLPLETWKTPPIEGQENLASGANRMNRVYHPRTISYCGFYRTDFVMKAISLCGSRLPVPSHDTFLDYVARRLGERIVETKMPGWKHLSRSEMKRLLEQKK